MKPSNNKNKIIPFLIVLTMFVQLFVPLFSSYVFAVPGEEEAVEVQIADDEEQGKSATQKRENESLEVTNEDEEDALLEEDKDEEGALLEEDKEEAPEKSEGKKESSNEEDYVPIDNDQEDKPTLFSGIRSFPAMPENPIDITPVFGASGTQKVGTGHTIYHDNFMVDFTGGPSRLRGAGQIWASSRVNLNEPFELEFYTYLGDAKNEDVADGITLMFHNNPNFTVGYSGSGMGAYHPNSGKAHTLEFDTYYNTRANSAGIGDHDEGVPDIRTTSGGSRPRYNNHSGHIAIRSSNRQGYVSPHTLLYSGDRNNPIANGEWLKVNYNWNPNANRISGSIGGANFSRQYNLRNDLEDHTNAIWGLTSSTGQYNTDQGVFFTKIDMPTVTPEDPTIEKDVDGETSSSVTNQYKRGESFEYNVKSNLPEDISGYENVIITDELDDLLIIDSYKVLVDGVESSDIEVTKNGQLLQINLDQAEIKELAGQEIKLVIETHIREDADGTLIPNTANITVNNEHSIDSNTVNVTPKALGSLEITKKEGDLPPEIETPEGDYDGEVMPDSNSDNSAVAGEEPLLNKEGQKSLAGAKFELIDYWTGEVFATLETDEDGYARLDDIPSGDYDLVEIEAPEGYELDSEWYPIYIVDNKTTTVTFYNKPLEKIDIPVEKKWVGNAGESATIELIKGSGDDLELVDTKVITEEDNWEHTFEDLYRTDSEGESIIYTIRELDLEGYDSKIERKNSDDIGKGFLVINTEKTGSIKIVKVDENGTPISTGAEFEILDSEGNLIREAELTDESGELTFDDLPFGDYQLVETKAPTYTNEAGEEKTYRLLTKPIDFTVDSVDEVKEIEVKNSKSGWELPGTGGNGHILFTITGILFMLAALFGFKKERYN